MKKKVSLKDIAARAKVSTAAVSYVLNNQEHRVAPELAQEIKEIARQLNYQPNQIAKSLKTRKTYTIGLIVADISYRFTTGITHAIEARAKENRYTVIFGSSDEDAEKFEELVNVLVNRQVDGLILVPSAQSQSIIQQLTDTGIPFVLIDRYFPELSASYIALDNFKAAHNTVNYLLDRGSSNMVFITYKNSFHHLQERSRGFLTALAARGTQNAEKQLIEVEQHRLETDLGAALQTLMSKTGEHITLYFATDTLAIAGLKFLRQNGYRVPEDAWVVSFDEAEAFELYPCPITHGSQPLDEMGKLAVDTLLELMEDPLRKRQQFLEAEFVTGKSCGEP